MAEDKDHVGKKVSEVQDDLVWVIVEHRRQFIGGTVSRDYREFVSWDDAEQAREQLERDPEFGVSYSIEHRLKK